MSDPNRPVRVYGLYDARDPDKRIRYVGVTAQPLEARLGQHARSPRPVGVWAREIGEHATAVVLEQTIWLNRHEREAHWTVTHSTLQPDGFNEALGKLPSARQRELTVEATKRAWADPSRRSARQESLRASRTDEANEISATLLRSWWTDDAYRAKMSDAASRGGKLSAHNRNHVARDIVKAGCELCEKS